MQVKILNSIDADSSPQMFKWLQSIKELSNGNVKTMKIVSEVTTRKEDSFVVILRLNMSLKTSIRGVAQVLFYTTRTVVHIISISRKHSALKSST